MTTYYVQTQHSSEKVETSLSEVATQIQRGLDDMRAVEQANAQAYANLKAGVLGVFQYAWVAEGRLLQSLRMWQLDRMTTEEYHARGDMGDKVDLFTASLKTAIFTQEEALKQIRAGGAVNASFFSEFKANCVRTFRGFTGLLCKDCGAVVNEKVYKQHLKSLGCMTMTTNRDLRDGGWVELSSGPDIAAVRAAGIDVEYRPSGYSIWAPPWVGNAIDAYQQNKGFAGMKMGEFIKRMAPREDKQG